MKSKFSPLFGLILGCFVAEIHADTLLTDFYSTNAMSFAYPGSTWATPVNQFEAFTNGGTFGQEILSIGGGNPTVSGGAGRLGLSLDLSGNNALQLTARLLPGNQAVLIQVLLFDADGTHDRFSFSSSSFNASIFSSAQLNFSSGTITVAGSTPGLDLNAITTYEVQGDFFDLGGNAAFDVQFDSLTAISAVPEPAPMALVAMGLLLFGMWQHFRTEHD